MGTLEDYYYLQQKDKRAKAKAGKMQGYGIDATMPELGFGEGVDVAGAAKEGATQVLGGVRDAIEELGNTLSWLATKTDLGAAMVAHGGEEGADPIYTQVNLKDIGIAEIKDPESTAGSLVRGASQFLTGFLLSRLALGPVGAGLGKQKSFMRLAAKYPSIWKAMGVMFEGAGAGFIADTAFFDPYDPNVADLIQMLHPDMKNKILDYMKSSPNDTQAEARFKKGIEGLGLGLVGNCIIPIAKGLRRTWIVNKMQRVHPFQAGEIVGTSMTKGGATWDITNNRNMWGDDVTMASIYKEREFIIKGKENLTEEATKKYMKKNHDLLSQESHAMGTWYNDETDEWFLDVSVAFRDKLEANWAGAQSGQLSVFNLATGDTIPTGGSKVTATDIPDIPIKDRLRVLREKYQEPVMVERFDKREGLTHIDPQEKGHRNIAGAEMKRLKAGGAPRRVHYYLGDYPYTGKPEDAVGALPFKYEASVKRGHIYDLSADPHNFKIQAKKEGMARADMNDVETLIEEMGYAGYINPNGPYGDTVAMFAALDVAESRSLKQIAQGILKDEGGYVYLEFPEKGAIPIADLHRVAQVGAAHLAEDSKAYTEWMTQVQKDYPKHWERVEKEALKQFESFVDETGARLKSPQEIEGYFMAGREGLEWYENTPRELKRLFGDDWEMMAGFLASTSGGMSVQANTALAMKAFTLWKQFGLDATQGFTGEMGFVKSHVKNLNKNLVGELAGSPRGAGRKVYNFHKTLLGDPDAVVVDRWMVRAYGMANEMEVDLKLAKELGEDVVEGEFGSSQALIPTQRAYDFIEGHIKRQAEILGVTPAQYQAAVWVGVKVLEDTSTTGAFMGSFEDAMARKIMDDPAFGAELGMSVTHDIKLGETVGFQIPKSKKYALEKQGMAVEGEIIKELKNTYRIESPEGIIDIKKHMVTHPSVRMTGPAESGFDWVAQTWRSEAGSARPALLAATARIIAGAAYGGTYGETLEDRILNAAQWGGLGAVLSPKLAAHIVDKVSSNQTVVKWMGKQVAEKVEVAPGDPITKSKLDLTNATGPMKDQISASWEDVQRKARAYPGAVEQARRGHIAREESLARGKEMLETGEVSLEDIEPGTAMPAEGVAAVDAAVRQMAEEVQDLAQVALQTGDLEAANGALEGFARLMSPGGDPTRRGVVAESGRALDISNETIENTWLDEIMKNLGEAENLDADRLLNVIATMPKPDEVVQMAQQAKKANWKDVMIEYWINGILSGPQTHMANFMGNFIATMVNIPERYIASKLGSTVKSGEAKAMLIGMQGGFMDALRIAQKSFLAGEPLSGVSKIEKRFDKAISSKALGVEGPFGKAIDYLGTAINLPTRMIMSADEFFKVVNYRAELYGQAYRNAVNKGITDPKEIGRWMEKSVREPTPMMKAKAKEFAAVNTFQNELGDFGTALSHLSASSPFVKLILPFVKTPVNIAKWTMHHTPLLAQQTEAYKSAIIKGGADADLAKAKLALGSMMAVVFVGLAATDMITGSRPQNRALAAQMKESGWQEHSIRIGGKLIGFDRLDPVGMQMSLVADFVHYIQGGMGSEGFDPRELDKMAAAIALSFADNVTSKTWMTGVSRVLAAIEEPERKGLYFLRNTLATFMPYSGAVSQLERAVHPELSETSREVRGLLDSVLSKMPFFSSQLPVKRHPTSGEAMTAKGSEMPLMWRFISPVKISTVDESPHGQMLRDLSEKGIKVGFFPDQYQGLPLRPEEKDFLHQLAGEKLGENLPKVVESDLFQLAAENDPELAQNYLDKMRRETWEREDIKQNFFENFPAFVEDMEAQQALDMEMKEAMAQEAQQTIGGLGGMQ